MLKQNAGTSAKEQASFDSEADRLAKTLIDEHGPRAAHRLATRITDHAARDNDFNKELLWHRVAEIIDETNG